MSNSTSYLTLKRNSIKYMLNYVEEYELVKRKQHPDFKFIRDFFKAKQICFQNFYKFYNRFVTSGRNPQALLPTRRGPKPKYHELPLAPDNLEARVLEYRSMGYNKYVIALAIKQSCVTPKACSPSTVYRILRKYGVSKMTPACILEKRKIVREKAGSLAHIDCHHLPKGIIKTSPEKRYYVLGIIDDYSRIAWVEVMSSVKAIDATFAMMDAILVLNQRYGISFQEALTDNGSEFCGSPQTIQEHPFERLLLHFGIKHRRTKPYRPQTNGKIERFWRSFHEDVIKGTEFQSEDELKDAVVGYNFFFNEHRPHQALNGKIPLRMLDNPIAKEPASNT